MLRTGAVLHGRLAVIVGLMVLWGAIIGARLFSLHVLAADEYRGLAERQQQRVLTISPNRGPIYDRNGHELAISIEVDSLYAVPGEVEDPRKTAAFLAGIFEAPASSFEARLDSERSFTWLRRKISARQAAAIRAAGIPGLYFQKEPERFYPNRELAAHVLGFVNIDNVGGGGLEYTYDAVVGGEPGKVVIHTDARGRSFHRLEQNPASGASLTTTIDRNIQYITEKELARVVQETQAAGVSIIVMDPNNGEIVAMANHPQFNPNQYGQFPPQSWSNRAISQVYEPGSTFKIVTAAAALEENLTTLDEVVDGQNGSIVIHGHRIRDHRPFGLLTVREVLQYSSDVGIIKLGLRLGDPLFADYISRMGFGRPSGVDLPGEERGLFKPASAWSRVSVGAISMGQEIGTTALQILNMVSMVANGGTLHRPFVVKRIDDPASGVSREIKPEGARVISARTAALLREALTAVVVSGTARAAGIPGYTAAGKTGTAQKIDPVTRRYSDTVHIASFAGFAPVNDPVYAAIVVIDEPVGAYNGGEIAAPVFGRLMEQVLRYRSALPDRPETLPHYTEETDAPAPEERRPAPGSPPAADWAVVPASFQANPGVSIPVSSGLDSHRLPVPDFQGKSLRQVTEDSLRLGLRLDARGSGLAVAQSPAPGSLVPAGARVQVRFSTESGR